jgi:hypothetical protein
MKEASSLLGPQREPGMTSTGVMQLQYAKYNAKDNNKGLDRFLLTRILFIA